MILLKPWNTTISQPGFLVNIQHSPLLLLVGVCEEEIPQGHSEQPGSDAELLSGPAVRAPGAPPSHQGAAVPRGPQRQHEWQQHPAHQGLGL